MFQYNEQSAIDGSQGGNSDYILESSVCRGIIVEAEWEQAQNSQAKFFKFNFEDETGRKCNFISICYQKKDGTPNQFGCDQMNALMAVTGCTSGLTDQGGKCPEIVRKQVALALERENYYKNDGSTGFKFKPKAFMSAKSWQTYAEYKDGKGPETKAYWEQRFAANPNGNELPAQGAPSQQSSYAGDAGHPNTPGNYPDDDFDQSIPF